jgi:hypothetical protein
MTTPLLVLVLEHNPWHGEHYLGKLANGGFNPTIVPTVRLAYAWFEQNPDLGLLIVQGAAKLDARSTPGQDIDGPRVVAEFRLRGYRGPIIGVSNSADFRAQFEAGGQCFVALDFKTLSGCLVKAAQFVIEHHPAIAPAPALPAIRKAPSSPKRVSATGKTIPPTPPRVAKPAKQLPPSDDEPTALADRLTPQATADEITRMSPDIAAAHYPWYPHS